MNRKGGASVRNMASDNSGQGAEFLQGAKPYDFFAILLRNFPMGNRPLGKHDFVFEKMLTHYFLPILSKIQSTTVFRRLKKVFFLLRKHIFFVGGVSFMAEEKRKDGRHILHMEERERLSVGGVLEVVSFDEDGVMMETSCGLLLLKGQGLHVGRLDLEAGEVSVDGLIESITYSDGTFAEKHSIFGKLFR